MFPRSGREQVHRDDELFLLAGLFAFAAVTALFLATSARIQGFYTADMGVKFWQIRAWLDSNWNSASLSAVKAPSELEVRFSIFIPPFFVRQGTELYTVYTNAFVAASAILYSRFGILGLYLIPWLSGGAGLLILYALGRRLGFGHSGLAVFMLGLASPWLFYSAVFWEHTLAVALTWAGMLLTLLSGSAGMALGGLLLGAGASLRWELIPWAVIWLAYTAWRRCRGLCWPLALAFSAMLLSIAASVLFQHFWTGQWLPLQVRANLSAEARAFQHTKVGYLSLERLKLSLLQVAGVLLSEEFVKWPLALCYSAQLTNLAFALFHRRKGPGPLWLTKATALATLGTLVVAVWAWMRTPVHASNDLALTAPFLLLLPLGLVEFGIPSAGSLPGAYLPLTAISLLFITVTVLVSPNGGGLQWGPRYLLVTSGPLSLVAAETVSRLWSSRNRSRILRAVVALAFLLGIALQGMGLWTLRQHRLCAEAVERLIPPGKIVVTDEKMMPYQFTPYLLGRRDILLVNDPDELEALREELSRRNVTEVLYLTWTEPSLLRDREVTPPGCRKLILIGIPLLSTLKLD